MVNPQLQRAIDEMKELAEHLGGTPQELRKAFEKLAVTPAADVRCTQVDAGGVEAEWIAAPGAAQDRFVLYLHGGGYVIGSVKTHRDLMARFSRASQARVLGLNYRLAPEHPFPAAVDDSVAAYRWLLAQGAQSGRTAIAGDSAGGGLAAATLVAIRDAKLPSPAAGVLISPWVDLEALGESITTRAAVDPAVRKEGLLAMAQAYLQGQSSRTPLAAPLYADLHGLPPLLIQVGDAETLLDDSTRLDACAQAAGVRTRLEVWPEMIHVWHLFANYLPEGQQAIDKIGAFVREQTN